MTPPYCIVPFKLFPPHVVTKYVLLIHHTRKKRKYKRNFKTQSEINSACIRWLTLDQRNIMSYCGASTTIEKKLQQRFTRPHGTY